MTAAEIKQRIYSVDFLRGVVMMLMLLDHTRDFVHAGAMASDPTDPATTTVPLFFTRWVTHFCAPTFVFLSGISIYLQKLKGKPHRELSWFLFTRGLWLIVLEFTLVRFGFVFNLDYSFLGVAQVIWVIGLSMIIMAALVWLPRGVIAAYGLVLVLFHNLLDGVQVPANVAFQGQPPPDLGQVLWFILHQPGVVRLSGGVASAFVAYPLIPWTGVMALGYVAGSVNAWDAERRRKWLIGLGITATVLFFAIRLTNFYGDAQQWRTRVSFVERMAERRAEAAASPDGAQAPPGPSEPELSEPAFTIIALLNTTKYPPSLLFLLMTLGPALIVLALTDRIDGRAIWQRVAIVYGRVPMFYYLLQFPLAHALAILLSLAVGKSSIAYYFMNFPASVMAAPPDAGFSLWVVYVMWIVGLAILYPLCLWYGNYKLRKKNWLLSYI
jgi:uncharacterized membrane protein